MVLYCDCKSRVGRNNVGIIYQAGSILIADRKAARSKRSRNLEFFLGDFFFFKKDKKPEFIKISIFNIFRFSTQYLESNEHVNVNHILVVPIGPSFAYFFSLSVSMVTCSPLRAYVTFSMMMQENNDSPRRALGVIRIYLFVMHQ